VRPQDKIPAGARYKLLLNYNLILVIAILITKYMQLKIPRGAMAPLEPHAGADESTPYE